MRPGIGAIRPMYYRGERHFATEVVFANDPGGREDEVDLARLICSTDFVPSRRPNLIEILVPADAETCGDCQREKTLRDKNFMKSPSRRWERFS